MSDQRIEIHRVVRRRHLDLKSVELAQPLGAAVSHHLKLVFGSAGDLKYHLGRAEIQLAHERHRDLPTNENRKAPTLRDTNALCGRLPTSAALYPSTQWLPTRDGPRKLPSGAS